MKILNKVIILLALITCFSCLDIDGISNHFETRHTLPQANLDQARAPLPTLNPRDTLSIISRERLNAAIQNREYRDLGVDTNLPQFRAYLIRRQFGVLERKRDSFETVHCRIVVGACIVGTPGLAHPCQTTNGGAVNGQILIHHFYGCESPRIYGKVTPDSNTEPASDDESSDDEGSDGNEDAESKDNLKENHFVKKQIGKQHDSEREETRQLNKVSRRRRLRKLRK